MAAQESSVWIEFAKAIPSIIAAIAAVIGVAIAARGLNKWRAETIGKRKAELAEDILADFYQARDIINGARSPGSFDYEGNTRKKADWENEDDTRKLNGYFATIERLNGKAEFFAALHARRYRFAAIFGVEAAKPYNELHKIYAELVVAVQMLINTHRDRGEGSLPKNRRKWEETIWARYAENDPIPSRLDRTVEAIEATCRPAIQESVK